ncbi:MAG: DoxX family protein [Bryobacterales bacterium]|nr:DoxX family protein [Bryobacterales bacterium]
MRTAMINADEARNQGRNAPVTEGIRAGSTPAQAGANAIAQLREVAADLGMLVLRAVLAVVFIYHGGQKLFGLFGGYGLAGTAGWMASIGIPMPYASAVLAGSAEFFGGAALLLGLWPRMAAIPMAFTMLVAIVTAHWGKFSAQAGGMEYPLTLAAALMAIALVGGGRLTVIEAWRRVRRRG